SKPLPIEVLSDRVMDHTHSTLSKPAVAPVQTSQSELPLVPLVLRPAPQIPGPSQSLCILPMAQAFNDDARRRMCFSRSSVAWTCEVLSTGLLP
ncbi:MAG TPA: hypothetical protein PL046_25845, partial [Polyangiaceae bacterium]|nr:hypothetical protein [Polyangiaceae bacterium]HPB99342.1 hypothetical protein [Polyangiaceae bacterium]